MFRKRKMKNELDPPPIASENPEAIEILRVWAAPGSPQQLTLKTAWKDPGTWGILLVDLAKHAAKAYDREGNVPGEALNKIREAFDTEWSAPTDEPLDITDNEIF